MSVILQVQVTDGLLEDTTNLVGSNTLDEGIELDGFLDSEFREDSIVLRAIADKLSSILELCLDVEALDGDLTGGRCDVSGQTLEGGRLASSIDSEKGETFTVIEAERGALDGLDRITAHAIILL